MKTRSSQPRILSAAQRGQIVQRVIVDGWTAADAAAAAGLRERVVTAWVRDFRRYGMASLRSRPNRAAVADCLDRLLMQPAVLSLRRMLTGMRKLLASQAAASRVPPYQARDDRRGGS